MAWYPRSVRKEIRAGASDPPIKVVGAILHVAVSNADSLFGWFNGPSGGIESHFYIRYDGVVEQYRDTGREADANYKANSFVADGVRYGYVSIETAGMGDGGWTAAQLASIRALLEWLSAEHDFPLRKCTHPKDPGVGYHSMWGSPGAWTPAVGKTCPGPGRIKQFERVLLPWMRAHGAEPRPPVEPKPGPAKAPKFPGVAAFKLGKRNAAVTALGKALKAKGFAKHHDGDGYQPGPTFTEYDRLNVADFQRSRPELAGDPDGYPGPLTWKALHS